MWPLSHLATLHRGLLGRSPHSPAPCCVLTCSLPLVELQQKDKALVELLREKVGLFAEMTHFQVEEDSGGVALPALPRGLFRSESLECPRGERLLQDAIREGKGAPGDEAEPGSTQTGWGASPSTHKRLGMWGVGSRDEAWALSVYESCIHLCCPFGAFQ